MCPYFYWKNISEDKLNFKQTSENGEEGIGSYHLMGPEFEFGKMKQFWKWVVVVVVQECECT